MIILPAQYTEPIRVIKRLRAAAAAASHKLRYDNYFSVVVFATLS